MKNESDRLEDIYINKIKKLSKCVKTFKYESSIDWYDKDRKRISMYDICEACDNFKYNGYPTKECKNMYYIHSLPNELERLDKDSMDEYEKAAFMVSVNNHLKILEILFKYDPKYYTYYNEKKIRREEEERIRREEEEQKRLAQEASINEARIRVRNNIEAGDDECHKCIMDTMHQTTSLNVSECDDKFWSLWDNGNFDVWYATTGPEGKRYNTEGCKMSCLGSNYNNLNYITQIKNKFEVFQCKPSNYDILKLDKNPKTHFLVTISKQ